MYEDITTGEILNALKRTQKVKSFWIDENNLDSSTYPPHIY